MYWNGEQADTFVNLDTQNSNIRCIEISSNRLSRKCAGGRIVTLDVLKCGSPTGFSISYAQNSNIRCIEIEEGCPNKRRYAGRIVTLDVLKLPITVLLCQTAYGQNSNIRCIEITYYGTALPNGLWVEQ